MVKEKTCSIDSKTHFHKLALTCHWHLNHLLAMRFLEIFSTLRSFFSNFTQFGPASASQITWRPLHALDLTCRQTTTFGSTSSDRFTFEVTSGGRVLAQLHPSGGVRAKLAHWPASANFLTPTIGVDVTSFFPVVHLPLLFSLLVGEGGWVPLAVHLSSAVGIHGHKSLNSLFRSTWYKENNVKVRLFLWS